MARSDVLCSNLCSKLREGSTALYPPRYVICVGDFNDRQGPVSRNTPVHGISLLRIIRSFLDLSGKVFPFVMPFLGRLHREKKLKGFVGFSRNFVSYVPCVFVSIGALLSKLPTIRAGCP